LSARPSVPARSDARARSGRGPRAAAILAALAAGAACGRSGGPEPPDGLRLVGCPQAGRSGVGLNEVLVLHFSDDLDQASVTRESVSIRRPDGRAAEGRLEVRRARIEFHPDLPTLSDLSDGGLLPGTAYTLELLGFPRPDALRDRDGRPLVATWRTAFRTVAPGVDSTLFLDPLPERPHPLFLVAQEIGPLDPILLECGEALDPTSLVAEEFELWRIGGGERERIPLRARLVSNRTDRARIELRPLREPASDDALRALDPGEIFLWIRQGHSSLLSLGGRRVHTVWGPNPVPVRVRGPEIGSVREEFESTAGRSPIEVGRADGTAAWGESGEVEVRWPAAAGDGALGALELAGVEERAELATTRLSVAAGLECVLAARGPVVLLAQGTVEIDGALRRSGAGAARAMEADFREWRGLGEREWRRLPEADWPTLGEWLAHVRALDEPWTVIVAGGDLRVSGRLEVDGPLCLIAGGWIRVSGRIQASEVWKSREGGGNLSPAGRLAPLALEAPATNPLRERLRFAVVSAPIRPPRGVSRWRAPRFQGDEGAGGFSVRFLGERDVGSRGLEVFGPVDDVSLLEGCQALRFVVELEVPPGEVWDPPRVDWVELSWYEPPHAADELERSGKPGS
jgi:hypothetical protein